MIPWLKKFASSKKEDKELKLVLQEIDKLILQEKWDKAIALCTKEMEDSPKNLDLVDKLGFIYLKKGSFVEAIQEYINYAEICEGLSLYDQAVERYSFILNLEEKERKTLPDHGFGLIGLSKTGSLSMSKTRLPLLKKTIEDYQVDLYRRISRAHLKADKWEEAIETYKKVLELSPSQAGLHKELGDILADHGKLWLAIAEYQQVKSLAPEDIQIYDKIAELYLKQNNNPAAFDSFAKGGHYFLGKGEYEKSRILYEKAINIKFELSILQNLYDIYIKQNNLAKITETFSYLLREFSKKADFNALKYIIEKTHKAKIPRLNILNLIADYYQEEVNKGQPNLENLTTQFLVEIYSFFGKLDSQLCPVLLEKVQNILLAKENIDLLVRFFDRILELEQGAELYHKVIYAYNNNFPKTFKEKYIRKLSEIYHNLLSLEPDNLEARFYLGNFYQIHKEWTQAEENYKEILRIEPENLNAKYCLKALYESNDWWKSEGDDVKIEVYRLMVDIYTLEENKGKVIEIYKKLMELLKPKDDRDKKDLLSIYSELTDFYKKQGDVEEILKVYKEQALIYHELKDHDHLLEVYQKIADIYTEQNRMEDAFDIYLKADVTYLKPDRMNVFLEIYNKMAEMYQKEENTEKLIETYQKIFYIYVKQMRFEESLEIHSHILELNYEEGADATELIKTVQKLINIYIQRRESAKLIESYLKLANLYEKQKRTLEAMEIYKKLVEIYSKQMLVNDLIEIYQKMADIYVNEEDFLSAKQLYSKIIDLSLDNVEVRERLAQVYEKSNISDLALKEYKNAAELYEKKGNTKDAIGVYRKIIGLEKETNYESFIKLGNIYGQEDMWHEAIQVYQKALELKEENIFALYNIAIAYFHLKEWGQFISLAKKIIFSENIAVEDKTSLEEIRSQMHMYLGLAYKECGSIDEAIHELQIALVEVVDPLKKAELCRIIGLCFLEVNLVELAIKQFLRGIDYIGKVDFSKISSSDDLYRTSRLDALEKEYLELYFHLGESYEELKMFEEAISAYEEIARKDISYRNTGKKLRALRRKKR